MEFAELIKISRVDNIRLRRPAKVSCDVTVAITGHHLILSFTEVPQNLSDREAWLLHRNIHSVVRETDSSRSGTVTVKYKDLRVFHLDIIGPDKLQALATTLELLSGATEPTSSYPFFYNPGFKALEDGWHLFRPEEEYTQILKGAEIFWRLSKVNLEFGVSSSYGKLLPVPSMLTDSQVMNCAKYRVGGRFPLLAYLHRVDDSSGNGGGCSNNNSNNGGPSSAAQSILAAAAASATHITAHSIVAASAAATHLPLVRASHTVAGWRNGDDEKLMSAILGVSRRGFILTITGDKTSNSSRPDYDISYNHWKKVTTKLTSLGDLSDSLQTLSTACNDPGNEKWLSKLATAKWLTNVKDVLNAACLAAQCLEKRSPVMVLEAGSTDLALVITSLTQIILNPDSRTLHGFEALIEREWLQGGHPFWTRHHPLQPTTPPHSSAPVFLLFLDCVFQIYSQFPCSFEFTEKLLILLADHSSASTFGTFLCNSEKERLEHQVKEHTVSLWSYLNQVEILSAQLNCLYLPNKSVIWPSVAPMSISLWSSYFLRWVQDQSWINWERRKMSEIIEKNKEAKANAIRLRKELRELQEEAVLLGVLRHADPLPEDEGEDGVLEYEDDGAVLVGGGGGQQEEDEMARRLSLASLDMGVH